MRRVGFFILSFLAASGAQLSAQLTAEEQREGWVSIFDGTTMNGWESRGELRWAVVDGAFQTIPEVGVAGFLATTRDYADYRVRVDFWADDVANGGVFLRGSPTGNLGGTEINIMDAHATFPTGSISGVQRYDPPTPTIGTWATLEVIIRGNHVVTMLNGRQAAEGDVDRPPTGRIGLQQNAAGGVIRYRNIRVLEL